MLELKWEAEEWHFLYLPSISSKISLISAYVISPETKWINAGLYILKVYLSVASSYSFYSLKCQSVIIIDILCSANFLIYLYKAVILFFIKSVLSKLTTITRPPIWYLFYEKNNCIYFINFSLISTLSSIVKGGVSTMKESKLLAPISTFVVEAEEEQLRLIHFENNRVLPTPVIPSNTNFLFKLTRP